MRNKGLGTTGHRSPRTMPMGPIFVKTSRANSMLVDLSGRCVSKNIDRICVARRDPLLRKMQERANTHGACARCTGREKKQRRPEWPQGP